MSNNEEFPLQNKQAALNINGSHTEILLTGFADRIFVVITQYGKIGSLVIEIVHD
jgi:proteasome assembly chaperone 3